MLSRRPTRLFAALVAGAGLASCTLPEHQPAPGPTEGTQAGVEQPPDQPPGTGTPAPGAGAQVTPAMSLADARRVQAEVMDFADDMTVRLAEALDAIETIDLPMDARVVAHRLKYTVAHGATIIASAQNPKISLVDMLVMITLQRALIERTIVPLHFGAEADRLRAVFEQSEREIRALAARTLTGDQLAEIDRLVERWLEENPDRKYAAYVRFSDYAAARQVVTGQRGGGGRPSNVLGFLFIDPLSGLDPTTREIEQTRLFAERALFYLQRMPVLVSWQAELLYIDTVGEPEVVQLVENANAAAASAERITAEVEALRAQIPELIASERGAALDRIAEIVGAEREAAIEQSLAGIRAEREAMVAQLADERDRLGALAAELRGTIEAGTELSDSVRDTSGAFSELARLLRLDEPRDPDSEPFRIRDYTEAIRETTRAAVELANLAESLSAATSPELLEARLALIEQRLAEAESSASRLMDRAFRLGLILVVVLVAGLAGVSVLSARLRRG